MVVLSLLFLVRIPMHPPFLLATLDGIYGFLLAILPFLRLIEPISELILLIRIKIIEFFSGVPS